MPERALLLAGGFTEETARELYAQGKEIAIFVMMQLTALLMKTGMGQHDQRCASVGAFGDRCTVSQGVLQKTPQKAGREVGSPRFASSAAGEYHASRHVCCDVLP